MDDHGNEQIKVGFIWAHGTEILHQSTWGVIEEVAALTPSTMGQIALGWHGYKSIAKSSYYAVAKFPGDNMHA